MQTQLILTHLRQYDLSSFYYLQVLQILELQITVAIELRNSGTYLCIGEPKIRVHLWLRMNTFSTSASLFFFLAGDPKVCFTVRTSTISMHRIFIRKQLLLLYKNTISYMFLIEPHFWEAFGGVKTRASSNDFFFVFFW